MKYETFVIGLLLSLHGEVTVGWVSFAFNIGAIVFFCLAFCETYIKSNKRLKTER